MAKDMPEDIITTARHLLQALAGLDLSANDLKTLMKEIPAFDNISHANEAIRAIQPKAKIIEDFAFRYAQGETPLGDVREFAVWLMGRANHIRQLTGDV